MQSLQEQFENIKSMVLDMKKQQKEYKNDCLFQLKNEKSGQESEVESELFIIQANNKKSKTSYKAIK